MRDYRNEIIQSIQEGLCFLNESDYDMAMAVIMKTLENYEVAERSTAIVPVDSANEKLLKTYLANMVINGLAKSTIEAYRRGITKFAQFIGQKDLKTTSTYDIRNYLAQEKVRGLSNTTLENVRANLCSFFSWLTQEEIINRNPCSAVRPIKCQDKQKKPFSIVELDRLRSSCSTKKERAMIELLVSSGVRVSELTALNVEDINFDSMSVHVRNGKGGKDRVTYIDELTKDHLVKYLLEAKIESGALFPSRRRDRYTPHGIRELLNTLAEKAKVENVHPHRFRRTFATTLAYRGMNIQDIQVLMGHTNINTTMTYIAMDDSQIQYAYRKHVA